MQTTKVNQSPHLVSTSKYWWMGTGAVSSSPDGADMLYDISRQEAIGNAHVGSSLTPNLPKAQTARNHKSVLTPSVDQFSPLNPVDQAGSIGGRRSDSSAKTTCQRCQLWSHSLVISLLPAHRSTHTITTSCSSVFTPLPAAVA